MYGYYGHDHGPGSDPNVRAADADREATADRLRQHHAEGRIDVNEFQERLDRTYKAKTMGELRQLVNDLPREPGSFAGRSERGAHLLGPWGIPWVPVVFLIIAISALTGGHHPGAWVLIPLFFFARYFFWGGGSWGRRRHRGTGV